MSCMYCGLNVPEMLSVAVHGCWVVCSVERKGLLAASWKWNAWLAAALVHHS